MSRTRTVQIVPLGNHSNVSSVSSALTRLGFEGSLVSLPSQLDMSLPLILPGVGTFAGAMDYLASTGLDASIRSHCGLRAPLIGICLGFQVLCRDGIEGSKKPTDGLGLLDGSVIPISSPSNENLLNVGWRRLEPISEMAKEGSAYFCHSYMVTGSTKEFHKSKFENVEIVASVKDAGIVGLQFHPELSGEFGLSLLEELLGP